MSAARVRRAVLPVVALAVTLVGAVGVHVWFDAPSFPFTAPVVEEAVRGQGEVAGNALVFRSAAFDPDDVRTPEGTRVLAVRLDVTAVSDTGCAVPELTETTGRQRTWVPANGVVGSGDDFTSSSTCSGFADDPYPIRANFLLPEDARGPFVLDFRASGSDDRLRFKVDPR